MLKEIKNIDGRIYFKDYLDNYIVVEQSSIESVVIDKKGRLNIFTIGGRHFMLRRSDYTSHIEVLNILFTNNEECYERENNFEGSFVEGSFVYVIYNIKSNIIQHVFTSETKCIEVYEFIQNQRFDKNLNWEAINLKYALEKE